ncbi:hypothetical protein [Microbacterium sp. NPDC058345]|uniref:hypothetical protein n=1 Tax=Microbacterium sp. NPDC058345 TaxID=3346455 RepID=UPI00365CCBC5
MSLVSDALRNRILAILGIALATTAIAALVAWKWPDSYTSSVDIMLTPSVGNALAPDSARSGDQINVAMQTEAGLIASPPVAELVGAEVGASIEPGDVNVTATVPANTQIIRVEYVAETADSAVEYADAYARALLESRKQRSENDVKGQLDALKTQEEAALAGLKEASTAAVDGNSPEAVGMVQLYTNRLATIQDSVGTLEATPTSPGSVISPASTPSSSDALPAPLLILAGLFAGILIGGVWAIWREWNDDRIRATLEGMVDEHQVMGIVPSGPDAVGADADAYRTVRTAVLAASAPPSTIVVAAVDGTLIDDAQQVALSTASALSASGYTTCLIDATLTEGPIAGAPGRKSRKGLASALVAGSMSGVAPRVADGFEILDGENANDETRELFGSAHMRAVLTELSTRYDYVLVASPDMSSAEASQLALAADGVMLVAAERVTTRESVRRVTTRAEQLGITFLGIVAAKRGARVRGSRRVADVDAEAEADPEPADMSVVHGEDAVTAPRGRVAEK